MSIKAFTELNAFLTSPKNFNKERDASGVPFFVEKNGGYGESNYRCFLFDKDILPRRI